MAVTLDYTVDGLGGIFWSKTIAASDETTDLTTGLAKVTFRTDCAVTLSDVRASVTTAPTGSTLEVDLNEGNTSVLSTILSIDPGETTSVTANTAVAIANTSYVIPDDTEMTIDIDQIGSGTPGAGLKVTLIGIRVG